MKYPIILLSLILSLSSCYQYAEQTYPTLDGTYILRSVTVNGTDVLNSEITNETYDDPMTFINLNVSYNTPQLNTYRHYVIIEDGLEYLTLECPKQYPDGVEGNEYNYSLTFYREGP